MLVHLVECREQALPTLPVEASDRSAQLVDRLVEFLAFLGRGFPFTFQFSQFVGSHQVNRSDPLAAQR